MVNAKTRHAVLAVLASCAAVPVAHAGTASLVLEARLQDYRFSGDDRLMQGATIRFTVLFDTDATPDSASAGSAEYRTGWMYEIVGRPLGQPDIREIGAAAPGGPTVVLSQGATADRVEVRFGNAFSGLLAGFQGMDIGLSADVFPGSGPPGLDALAAIPGPPDSAFSNTELVAATCTAPEDEPHCLAFAGDSFPDGSYLIHAPRYTLIPGPAIFDQPDAQAVNAGDEITLTTGAAAFGTPSYQWFRNGEALSNGGRFSGVDTAELSIGNAAVPDNGVYTAEVTDDGSTTTSDAAVVAVIPGANCSGADLAPPFGILDLADINAFVIAFTSMDPQGDLDGNGIFDLADITAFVKAFVAGCP